MNFLTIISTASVIWLYQTPGGTTYYKTEVDSTISVTFSTVPVRCETFQVVERRIKIAKTGVEEVRCQNATLKYGRCLERRTFCDAEWLVMDDVCADKTEVVWRREEAFCDDGVVRWRGSR